MLKMSSESEWDAYKVVVLASEVWSLDWWYIKIILSGART
jgi:hypothetical protein